MQRRTLLAAVPIAVILAGCSSSQDHTTMGPGGSMGPVGSMPHSGAPGSIGSMPMGNAMPMGTAVPIPAGADHNGQDVLFAQEMILHHAQAVMMADMALQRGVDPRVKDLATRIKAAQDPEIQQLRGWLGTWGQPAPDPMAAGDMRGMNMPSMMSAEDMKMLGDQSGAGFDRMFLEQMIRHHEGAVAMARTEVAGGKYASAIEMANTIATSQSQEIAEMRSILG